MGKGFGIIFRPLEGIKELIVNPDYGKVERLNPLHGALLFVGWTFLYLVLSFTLGSITTQSLEEGNLLINIAVVELPLLLLCIIAIVALRLKIKDLKLRKLSLLEWATGIILAVIALIGAAAILILVVVSQFLLTPKLFGESLEQAKVMQEAMTPASNVELVINILLLALIPAIAEELMFRGLIMDCFMRWGPFWAITISSIAFGISHQMPLRIPSLIFVGLVLGAFKYRTGKLTASILIHFIYNSMLLTIVYLASGELQSDMVSFIGL